MTNALNRFFGRAYERMTDADVLVTHSQQVVERPENFFGGDDNPIGRWLIQEVGIDNHCWLSATGRASHLFFMTPALAQRFRDFMQETVPGESHDAH